MNICIVEGYHSLGQAQTVRPCEVCAIAVCVEHRGLHWERAHKPPDKIGFRQD